MGHSLSSTLSPFPPHHAFVDFCCPSGLWLPRRACSPSRACDGWPDALQQPLLPLQRLPQRDDQPPPAEERPPRCRPPLRHGQHPALQGWPSHGLPPQPYTSAHNMVPIATAVHDPTFVSKNGEVEHVVKGIHAETAIKNIHGVTKREAEPMVDGVHARTAVNTMPITTGMISPTMGHAIANVYSGYPMTYGTGIVNNTPFRTSHITPTMAQRIAPTMTHSMLHPFHAGQPMVRTIAPSSHTGSIISHSGIHGVTTGLHGINAGIHGFPRMA